MPTVTMPCDNNTLPPQNELAILEFIHCLVETLDRYFGNVCELDLMFNLEMVCGALCAIMWRSGDVVGGKGRNNIT